MGVLAWSRRVSEMRAVGLFRPVQGEEATTRVTSVVKAFDKVNADAVTPTAHFATDLGLDSLDIVELGLALEEEFAIEIPDADAEGLLSIPDAVEYLSTHPQSR